MPKKVPVRIDLSFVKAAKLFLPPVERWRFILAGCGGTGSWLAPSIARAAKVLQDRGKEVAVWFVDPDHVEQKNIPRQNFCEAEIGANKALALSARYSAAWGIKIAAINQKFDAKVINGDFNRAGVMTIIFGCVDNAAARRSIAEALKQNIRSKNYADRPHSFWWLDCGNSESAGQVVLGSAPTYGELSGSFLSRKTCVSLPSPHLVQPSLFEVKPEEEVKSQLSCAEIQIANEQSLAINQMVASVATDYLLRFINGGLKRFATYFDLEAGSMRSDYLTPEAVAAVVRKPVQFVLK